MPEITLQVGELQADSSWPSCFGLHENHAAFALLFGYPIHQQHRLTALYLGDKWEQAAMGAHGIRHRDVAEWAIVWRAAVDSDRNG